MVLDNPEAHPGSSQSKLLWMILPKWEKLTPTGGAILCRFDQNRGEIVRMRDPYDEFPSYEEPGRTPPPAPVEETFAPGAPRVVQGRDGGWLAVLSNGFWLGPFDTAEEANAALPTQETLMIVKESNHFVVKSEKGKNLGSGAMLAQIRMSSMWSLPK